MVDAAVLAAGRSLRMGRPKALLPCAPGAPGTFLARIVTALQAAGVPAPMVVGRPDDQELRDAVQRLAPARFLPNPSHARGPLTSILAALDAVEGGAVQGLLVMPVDMPFVRVETFAAILQAARANPRRIVRACHDGRHGHPVVFDRESFAALRAADPLTGAKSVLRASPGRVLDVETGDPGVLRDVDTIEEYVDAFGVSPGAAR